MTSSLVHEVVRVFAVFAVFVSQDVFAFEDRCIQARAAVSCKAFLDAPHGMSNERIELLYGTIIGQVHYNRQPFYSYVLRTYPSFEAQHLWDSSVVLGHSQNYRRSPY